jgi:2-polyprenyl-3-methyl-5-hydroxy-6-metoxy-1,4-benzoquinol methylase
VNPTSSSACPLCGVRRATVVQEISVDRLAQALGSELWSLCRDDFGATRSVRYCRCPACDLRFFEPCVTGSDAFYQRFSARKPTYYLDEKPEFAVAARYVGAGDRILEIGAGKGAYAKMIPAADYTGLEFNARAVSLARDEGVALRRELLSEHAAGNEARYDMVCAFQVLEHVRDPREFILDALHCLTPGGRLVVSVPNNDSFVGLLRNAVANLPPHHVTRWSEECLRNLGRLYPLELVELNLERLQPLHFESYALAVAARCVPSWGEVSRDPEHVVSESAERTLRAGVRRRLVRGLAKLYVKGLQDPRLLPRGHSATAVYRKAAGR